MCHQFLPYLNLFSLYHTPSPLVLELDLLSPNSFQIISCITPQSILCNCFILHYMRLNLLIIIVRLRLIPDGELQWGRNLMCFCPMAPGVFLSFPFQPQYHWNKWVYKIKQKPNGWVERFEAKLAAKGIWSTMWHRLHWDFQPRDKAIYHQNYFSFDSSICLRY